MMYRRAGLSAGASRPRHRPPSRSRSCWSSSDDEAYCQPCVSPVWDTALGGACPAGSRGEHGRWTRRAARPGLAEAAAGAGCQRRLGRASARCARPAAGRSSIATLIIPISTTPPWWSMALDRAAAIRAARYDEAIARGREWVEGLQSRNGGWGAFDADNSLSLSQQHPLRRSWRAARSADRRRDGRAASACWRSCGRQATSPHVKAAHRLSCVSTQRDGRKLVRPLGRELHLRHLVGAAPD